MSITLDQALSMKLQDALKSGEGVQLPFPVVYLWTINGMPSFKQVGGALYFGGFACKKENMDEAIGQAFATIPAGFVEAVVPNRDGTEYEAYTTRLLAAAPIGFREAWILDGKRMTHYYEGSRQHVQILAYMAERVDEGKKLAPWGPVVLSAKGYQAKNLKGAFRTWDKDSARARAAHAPGVPAWAFYAQVGTFGKDRKAENVGKSGAQSPITPISAYIPEELGEAHLSHLFVGAETAQRLVELREQAREWLEAWRKPDATEEAEAEAEAYQPVMGDIPF